MTYQMKDQLRRRDAWVTRRVVERLMANMPTGREDSFKDHNSDMAVGYRNGWLAAKLYLKRSLDDWERESSLGRDAEGHLVLTLGPGAESPSRKGERE